MKTKKLITTAFIYAIAAMCGGVFYREFTKFNGFVDMRTTLGFVHTHLFMLGMVFFLIVAILDKSFGLSSDKGFDRFYGVYNAGVIMAAVMLVVRGVLQVMQIQLSSGMSAAISGVAGIGHIILAVGIIMFFRALQRRAAQ